MLDPYLRRAAARAALAISLGSSVSLASAQESIAASRPATTPANSTAEPTPAETPLEDRIRNAIKGVQNLTIAWYELDSLPFYIEVAVLDAERYQQAIASEYLGTVGLEPGGNGIARTRAGVSKLAADAAAAFPMFYAVLTGELLVRDDAPALANSVATETGADTDTVLGLMAVRAIGRLAQLEAHDMIRPARRLPTSIPPFEVHRAAMLGHAAWVQRRIATDTKPTELHAASDGDEAPNPLPDAVAALRTRRAATDSGRLEDAGLAFVDAALSTGTMKDVWSVISRPPDRLDVIAERLDNAEAARDARSPFGDALIGFEKMLPQGDWEYRSRAGNAETVLGRSLILVERSARQQLIDNVVFAEQLGWTDTAVPTGRYCAVTVLRFGSASEAAASLPAFNIVVNVMQDRLDTDPDGNDRPARALRVGADTATIISGSHEVGAEPAASFVASARLSDALVVINMLGIPGDDQHAEPLTTEIITRLRGVVDSLRRSPSP